ncbi:putative quinol monooxygenase [Falsihalocynthiibacter sp. SS001]|uniref:putative quinol monooxygenase n=1 Tax=Falsihalocynthiibacter sp. SS001 TaxID=3349698 RepID=UPI0036D23BFB
MFAVCVKFTINTYHIAEFGKRIERNAAISVTEEAGCQLFDVCTDPESSNVFFLYEIYDDAAAFDVHIASDHFKEFNQATEHMVAKKELSTYSKVTAARA